jgi:DNA/RNA-binding domain of Phe-tRNA-synthetase-like protein
MQYTKFIGGTMIYKIESEVFDMFPELRIGVVVGQNISIEKENDELRKLIHQNVQKFLDVYSMKDIIEHPNIASWRETYKKFGVKPKKHTPTAEALLRRVLKGEHPFPNINTAVDSYLAVELLYLLPIGGYDLSKIEGDIILRISKGDEIFYPIGGGDPSRTKAGEVIYSDNHNVLTQRWNYRDAEHSKISTSTKDLILATEAAYYTIKDEDIKGTVDTIVEYERKFCGGNYKTFFLDINNREVNVR